MGNCCVVEGAVDHWIYVKIGDRKQPLSDAKLRVIVEDSTGKQSSIIKLDCSAKNEFERGSQEVFEVRCCCRYALMWATDAGATQNPQDVPDPNDPDSEEILP